MRAGQHYDAVNQRLGDMGQRIGDVQQPMGQRFDGVNERLGDMNQRVDRVETRLDNLERHTGRLGEGMARLDAKVEDVRRREWAAMTMMELGFVGLIVAILLAARVIG